MTSDCCEDRPPSSCLNKTSEDYSRSTVRATDMTQQVNNSGSQGLLLDGQHKVNWDTWWGLGTESQLSEQIWHLDRPTEGCRSLPVQHLFTACLLWWNIFYLQKQTEEQIIMKKQIAHSIPVRAGDLGAGRLTCGLNHSVWTSTESQKVKILYHFRVFNDGSHGSSM